MTGILREISQQDNVHRNEYQVYEPAGCYAKGAVFFKSGFQTILKINKHLAFVNVCVD
jgi:hypothetical protein